jgi:hypothetical protein
MLTLPYGFFPAGAAGFEKSTVGTVLAAVASAW